MIKAKDQQHDLFIWVSEVVKDADSFRDLTPWERSFIDNMQDKIDRFGVNMTISEAQLDALRSIEEKIYV